MEGLYVLCKIEVSSILVRPVFRMKMLNPQKEYAQLLAQAAGRIDQMVGLRIVGSHHFFKLASQVLALPQTTFLPR